MCLPHIRLQLFTLIPIFFYYVTHVHLLQFSPPSIPDILCPPPPSFARFCDTRNCSLYYINDLPACLSFSIPRMYADDTGITYADSDLHFIQSSLSHDLEKLSKWIVSNTLTLNATKTEFMLIISGQRLSTLSYTLERSIDNVPIEQVPSVKSLGIFIDENLTWHSHIDKLCTKIASGAIKRVKPFVPQSTLLNIYILLVGVIVANIWQATKTVKPCKTAARVISSSNFDVDVDSLFHKLSWKDLKSQRQIQNALMVFKSLNGWFPNISRLNL